eukprot:2442278-Prymnesium_polylepis.2
MIEGVAHGPRGRVRLLPCGGGRGPSSDGLCPISFAQELLRARDRRLQRVPHKAGCARAHLLARRLQIDVGATPHISTIVRGRPSRDRGPQPLRGARDVGRRRNVGRRCRPDGWDRGASAAVRGHRADGCVPQASRRLLHPAAAQRHSLHTAAPHVGSAVWQEAGVLNRNKQRRSHPGALRRRLRCPEEPAFALPRAPDQYTVARLEKVEVDRGSRANHIAAASPHDEDGNGPGVALCQRL